MIVGGVRTLPEYPAAEDVHDMLAMLVKLKRIVPADKWVDEAIDDANDARWEAMLP